MFTVEQIQNAPVLTASNCTVHSERRTIVQIDTGAVIVDLKGYVLFDHDIRFIGGNEVEVSTQCGLLDGNRYVSRKDNLTRTILKLNIITNLNIREQLDGGIAAVGCNIGHCVCKSLVVLIANLGNRQIHTVNTVLITDHIASFSSHNSQTFFSGQLGTGIQLDGAANINRIRNGHGVANVHGIASHIGVEIHKLGVSEELHIVARTGNRHIAAFAVGAIRHIGAINSHIFHNKVGGVNVEHPDNRCAFGYVDRTILDGSLGGNLGTDLEAGSIGPLRTGASGNRIGEVVQVKDHIVLHHTDAGAFDITEQLDSCAFQSGAIGGVGNSFQYRAIVLHLTLWINGITHGIGNLNGIEIKQILPHNGIQVIGGVHHNVILGNLFAVDNHDYLGGLRISAGITFCPFHSPMPIGRTSKGDGPGYIHITVDDAANVVQRSGGNLGIAHIQLNIKGFLGVTAAFAPYTFLTGIAVGDGALGLFLEFNLTGFSLNNIRFGFCTGNGKLSAICIDNFGACNIAPDIAASDISISNQLQGQSLLVADLALGGAGEIQSRILDGHIAVVQGKSTAIAILDGQRRILDSQSRLVDGICATSDVQIHILHENRTIQHADLGVVEGQFHRIGFGTDDVDLAINALFSLDNTASAVLFVGNDNRTAVNVQGAGIVDIQHSIGRAITIAVDVYIIQSQSRIIGVVANTDDAIALGNAAGNINGTVLNGRSTKEVITAHSQSQGVGVQIDDHISAINRGVSRNAFQKHDSVAGLGIGQRSLQTGVTLIANLGDKYRPNLFAIHGDRQVGLIPLVVPQGVAADGTSGKAGGSGIIDGDDSAIHSTGVVGGCGINFDSSLVRNFLSGDEFASFNSQVGGRATLVVNQHGLTSTVERTIFELNFLGAVGPNVVMIGTRLIEGTIIEDLRVTVQERLTGDGTIVVLYGINVLEAVVIHIGILQIQAIQNKLRTMERGFLVLQVDSGIDAFSSFNGQSLVAEAIQRVGAIGGDGNDITGLGSRDSLRQGLVEALHIAVGILQDNREVAFLTQSAAGNRDLAIISNRILVVPHNVGAVGCNIGDIDVVNGDISTSRALDHNGSLLSSAKGGVLYSQINLTGIVNILVIDLDAAASRIDGQTINVNRLTIGLNPDRIIVTGFVDRDIIQVCILTQDQGTLRSHVVQFNITVEAKSVIIPRAIAIIGLGERHVVQGQLRTILGDYICPIAVELNEGKLLAITIDRDGIGRVTADRQAVPSSDVQRGIFHQVDHDVAFALGSIQSFLQRGIALIADHGNGISQRCGGDTGNLCPVDGCFAVGADHGDVRLIHENAIHIQLGISRHIVRTKLISFPDSGPGRRIAGDDDIYAQQAGSIVLRLEQRSGGQMHAIGIVQLDDDALGGIQPGDLG